MTKQEQRIESFGLSQRVGSEQSWNSVIHSTGEQTPNDPKLSDGGGWRAGCMVGGKAAVEAASVTAGAVRCSAWLGVAVIWIFR